MRCLCLPFPGSSAKWYAEAIHGAQAVTHIDQTLWSMR